MNSNGKQVQVRLPGRKAVDGHWNIITNLTDRWGDINDHDAENKPLQELEQYDGVLLKALREQMWGETTFVVQKDNKFGILYEVEFVSKQSEKGLSEEHDLRDHAVMVNAIAMRLESLSSKFPGVEFAVPHESEIANDRPAAWAFAPFGLLSKEAREKLGRNLLNLMTAESDSDMGFTTVDVRHCHAHVSNQTGAPEFEMQIFDQRKSKGMVYIDVGASGGDIDDMMSAVFLINTLPGTETHTQTMLLQFLDESAMTIFKQGDKYILLPENGASIEPFTLENGERAFVLKL